jgi:GT2 family glycosyltransferase
MLGVVAIGRNEGQRLKRCLESIAPVLDRTVYVDSGSTDDSVILATSLGTAVVVLDRSLPYTAARARNAGFEQLIKTHPALGYVFFVDGDCEVAPGWLEEARRFLDQRAEVGVVWGRRRERHPEHSIYNMLCDMEWHDLPIGETAICGGDAVIRVAAFQTVAGYRSELICGEEPELCIRLRRAGWKVWRMPAEMTIHDAALRHFGQWWKRTLRGGYAYAQGVKLHGAPPDRLWVTEWRRAWLWGLGIPLATLALSFRARWWALLLLMLYPLQVLRLALIGNHSMRRNWWRAGALVLGKFPEMIGQMKFVLDQYRRTKSQIIEYK